MVVDRIRPWLLVLVAGIATVLLTWDEVNTAITGAVLIAQLSMLLVAAHAVIHRNAVHRSGWWLLLASSGLSLALNTEHAALVLPNDVWSVASAAVYATFLVGVIVLLDVRQVRPTEQNLMDTGIVAAGLMVVGWAFLILPRLSDRVPQTHHTGIAVSFAALDLVMFAILVRIASTPSSRAPPSVLLGFAGAALVAGHVTTVVRAGADGLVAFDAHGTMYFAVQLNSVLVAAAAFYRGYRFVSRAPHDESAEVFPRWRLVVFIAVAVVASFVPAVGLLRSEDLVSATAGPAMIGSATLTCLVMVLLVLRLGNFAQLAVRRADAMNTQSAAILLQARALQQALDDQHALQNELAHRALHDPLTGLANRALLAERLGRMLCTDGRPDGGLLLIDLDGFKEVNDVLGHPVGDELLTRVAQRLRLSMRTDDVVARLGGDEFAVLMVDADADGCRVTAGRVIDTVGKVYQLGHRRPTITSSAGLLILGPGRVDPAEALRDVDLALYEAKQAGRNQVVEFNPKMREAHLRHAELAANVRTALDDNELSIHYQPIVDLSSGHTVALEALLRWRTGDAQHVTPSQFIAVAEDIGLIGDIGSEVLRGAASQASQWHAHNGLSISVNISGGQLASPTFAAEVLHALDESGLPPTAMIIEITETVLFDATKPAGELAMRSLQRLRYHGVRIAVDDFGTGYSSLSYLQRLPIDILKIDQMFAAILQKPSDRSTQFVGAILGLGASLGLPVVAEGVETARQADILHDLGCPLGQGFYFARPCPATEVIELIGKPLTGKTRASTPQVDSEKWLARRTGAS